MSKTTTNGANGGMLEGASHDNGGIPVVVKSTGQPIEVEGGESILSRASMQSNKEYTVTGTPKEIASAVNSVDGNGVAFEHGAELTDHQTGETKVMAEGGYIPDPFDRLLWFLGFNGELSK